MTCCSTSYSLRFIASSGADAYVNVWSFDTARLEFTAVGHSEEVAVLVFLEPYPLLLSADVAGKLCVWALPILRQQFSLVAVSAPPSSFFHILALPTLLAMIAPLQLCFAHFGTHRRRFL